MFAKRNQTAQQKLNNFLRSTLSSTYPLCPSKILILHALASFTYYKNQCNPSLSALGAYCRLKKRNSLSVHLKNLHALNLIEIIKKNGCKNIYLWKVPSVEDEDIYKRKSVDKSRNNSKPLPSRGGGNHYLLRGVV